MPSTDQAAQIAQSALAAPINNLVVIGILLALIVVLGGGWLTYKFGSVGLRMFNKLTDAFNKLTDAYKETTENLSKLTELQGLNVEQRKLEHSETKSELEKQTVLLKSFTDFQKANNETVGNLADEFGVLKTTVTANSDKIAELKVSIDNLSEQIKNMLEDKAVCADVEERITKLRDEIVALVTQQQAKHATDEHERVSNVLPDTDAPAKAEAA